VPYFGTVVNQEMQLSEIGRVVHDEWLKTPLLRPDMKLQLGAFVVMPNHFHALINIPLQENKGLVTNKFGSQSNNLASIVRGFKSAITMYARKNNLPFEWQPNYHDSKIKGPRNWLIVTKYINNNPKWWGRKRRRAKKASQ
jgi:putative transposase